MNPIITTQAKRLAKTCAAVILSFSVAFSVGMVTNTTKTYAASAASIADQVIATGKQFIGVPYKFSAEAGNTSAFDCSSFTQYVFKQNGIDLPRSSREQAKAGTYVSRTDLQPGDLVFSDTNHDGVINHVSIYIGDGKLLHTYRVGIGVTISDYEGSTWDKTYVTARRVIQGDSSNADQAAPAKEQPAVEAPTTKKQPAMDQQQQENHNDQQQNNPNNRYDHSYDFLKDWFKSFK